MSKSMKALVLAGVLSIAAASAAQAGGKVTGGDFHANAVPAGGTARSGQIPHIVEAGLGWRPHRGQRFPRQCRANLRYRPCPVLGHRRSRQPLRQYRPQSGEQYDW